ncbi:MAG: DUF481 domain-containing protein [Opitutaceae bacterium]
MIPFKRQIKLFFAFIGAGVALSASPKAVSLDSGERLIGTVLEKSTDEFIYLQSGFLGEVAIPRERVVKIEDQNAPSIAKVEKPVVKAKKPEPVKPKVAVKKEQIVLTDDEIELIEERRVIDTLREFNAPDSWKGNLRLGLNLSQGDRKWIESFVRGNLEIKPKGSRNFYRFNGSYTYRETERSDGSEYRSTDKYDASFIYRRTLRDNWFAQNSMGYRVDQIKGINRELQEAVGIGYKFKPTNKFEVLLGGGGGIEELQADFEDTRDGLNPLVNVFQEATWKPGKRTSFVQKFNYYWNPENNEQYNYALSAAVRFRLTDLVGFEFSYKQDFDNDTGNGNSKDDIQWRNALVVYF